MQERRHEEKSGVKYVELVLRWMAMMRVVIIDSDESKDEEDTLQNGRQVRPGQPY